MRLTCVSVLLVIGCGASAPPPMDKPAPTGGCWTDVDACIALAGEPLPPHAQARCDRGDATACFALAMAAADGATADPRRALQLYDRACGLGHPMACGLGGLAYAQGQGTTADVSIAMARYRKACDAGEPNSCDLLGQRYQDGEVVRQDLAAAARLYARSCKLHPGSGCHHQAMLLDGDTPDGQARACKLLEAGCAGGDDGSCADLMGCGNETFYNSRQRTLTAASLCDGASHEYCSEAGAAYAHGAPALAKDVERAHALLARGCEGGFVDSCVGLARLYAQRLRKGDPRKVLDDACARAVAGACLASGRAARDGTLTGRDPALALRDLERACNQGELAGCAELAVGRRDGLGGAAAPAAVRAAFRAACGSGSVPSCREGQRLAGLDADSRRWFAAQACFHGDTCTTPAPAAAIQMIDLTWRVGDEIRLAFVGDDGHGLLAAAGDRVALLDPAGRVAGDWFTLSSKSLPSPRLGGTSVYRAVAAGVWGWDAAAHAPFAAVVDERGLAVWSPTRQAEPAPVMPPAHAELGALALSPDLKRAIARNHGGFKGAYVVDLATRTRIGGELGHGFLHAGDFHRNGRDAVLGFERGELVAVHGDQVTTLAPADGLDTSAHDILALSCHPSRRVVAAAQRDGHLAIWQLDTGAVTRLVQPATQIAFAPDGHTLAVVDDKSLVLLDTETWERRARPLTLGRSNPDAIAFSADGRYLAVAHNVLAAAGGVSVVDLAPGTPAAPIDAAWFRALRAVPPPPLPVAPAIANGGELSGRVLLGDQPVAGAEVRLEPSYTEWPNARALAPRVTHTGADGKYAFHRLPRIAWGARAIAADTQVAYFGSAIDLRDQPAVYVEFALNPAIVVRGRVLDPAGRPAAGVTVHGPVGREVTAVTDGAGRFTVRHVPPGEWLRLQAVRADGAAGTAYFAVEPVPTDVVLRLKPARDPRVVHVRVVDEAGTAVAGVYLQLLDGAQASTDAAGRATLEAPNDHPRLQAWPNGYRPEGLDLALPVTGEVRLVLTRS